MDAKFNLRQLLADNEVMEGVRNTLGSGEERKVILESLPSDETNVESNLDRLLSGDQEAVSADDQALSQLEAIILFIGRPSLLIQDGKWEKPKMPEIRRRLEQSKNILLQAIPNVGRVEIINTEKFKPFLGTGWMIDEGIMITNRHVAEIFAERRNNSFIFRHDDKSGEPYQVNVDFKKEHQRSAQWQARVKEIIFLEEKIALRPDMALIMLDAEGSPLPNPIDLDDDNPKFDADIAVIGYPAKDSRNDLVKMMDLFNDIFNVKRLSPGKVRGVGWDGRHLIHDCTTLGGNSGSPVLNLTTGKVCGLHFGGQYQVENRAVSIGWLKSRLFEISHRMSVVLPVLEKIKPVSIPTTEIIDSPSAPESVQAEGYDSSFLGEGISVPLPDVPNPDLIAPVKGTDDGVLRYTHFSIVMHKERRLPFFTACNINGQLLYNFPRSRDRWQLDGRLEEHERRQIGEELYRNNSLDRGHLVRRLDPAWGETREEAKRGEQDTFFFTNCSPQHSQLNQRTWLSLEDYILGNAGTHSLKVCVFTGPVMSDADPVYRGVQIPKEFWKVVAVRNAFTGQLSTAAYLLSQAEYLDELEFVFGQFRTYQVTISKIEEKTGLGFGELSRYDQMKHIEGLPFRVISNESDIVI